MPAWIRTMLAVVVGAVVAFALVGIIEAIGERVFPPTTGVDFTKPAELAAYVERLPVGAKLFVVAAWVVATFAGGLVAAWIARPRAVLVSAIVGALVLVATIANLAMIPHPAWMAVAGIAGISIAAFAAGRIMRVP